MTYAKRIEDHHRWTWTETYAKRIEDHHRWTWTETYAKRIEDHHRWTWTETYDRICLITSKDTHTYTHTFAHTQTYTHTYTHTQTHRHAHMREHTHTYTHTHIHTCKYIIIIIIIIISGQLAKRRMCTLCTSRAILQWVMMGKDEAGTITRVNYRRHDTFTCRQPPATPHHRIGIITPDKLPVPIYRPDGMDSLVS